MNNPKKKFKKSVVLPVVVSIYFLVMCVIYGPKMIASGEALKFWFIALAEVVIIIAMALFLRKREKIDKK